MRNIFEGEYITDRDGGVLYRYAGVWTMAPEVKWRVQVWRGRFHAGEVSGQLEGGPPLDVKRLLLGLVWKSIEWRIGVS